MKVKATDYLVYDEKTKKYREDPEQVVRDDVEKHHWKHVGLTILTELLGDNTNVYVDMQGDKVILKVDPHDTPEIDTKVSYFVPHKSIYLFDTKTEEVINKY